MIEDEHRRRRDPPESSGRSCRRQSMVFKQRTEARPSVVSMDTEIKRDGWLLDVLEVLLRRDRFATAGESNEYDDMGWLWLLPSRTQYSVDL